MGKQYAPIPEEINKITGEIIGAAMTVHTELGPGLLESIYEVCLIKELQLKGLKVDRQVPIPVIYRGEQLEAGFRIDLLVEDKVVVELKAAEKLLPIHEAQVLTYLKLTNQRLGLLLNFNVVSMQDGIKRVAL
jgi:GxxExxY protein